MIQLFETDSIDSNCKIGPNDQPFSMPVIPQDHLFLRLQVPYYLVQQNGGGMPIAGNISVSFTDITGVPNLCDLGKPSTGKYLYNFINDATKRIAEYRFMIPLSFVNYNYKTKSFSANAGDEIVCTIDGVVYTWIYGTEPTPYPFVDYKSGFVAVRKPNAGTFSLLINGGAIIAADLFTDDELGCLGSYCFRVKININFSSIPVTKSYYTKMFQYDLLCNEDTIYLHSEYGTDMVDCAGQYYNGSYTNLGSNELYLRIPGDLERAPSRLTKTINSKCFLYRSDITKQVRMRSIPVPDWFQEAIETLMLGKNFKVDGVPYQFEQENIFENNDLTGTTFQNINVLLQSCKCDNVFVC